MTRQQVIRKIILILPIIIAVAGFINWTYQNFIKLKDIGQNKQLVNSNIISNNHIDNLLIYQNSETDNKSLNTTKVSVKKPTPPHVFLMYTPGKLGFENHGKDDIYFHGYQFANELPIIFKHRFTIPGAEFGNIYDHHFDSSWFENIMRQQMTQDIEKDEEKVFELKAYFSDSLRNRYIAKYGIVYSLGNQMETQQLGISEENGNKKLYNN